ncbi:MFS transporter [Nocardioides gilvus]|uniref:MFS transporter n=1 Tax=Nocardioides gilvus TaxID=1735589 RepID=UPI000D74BD97|nr:MFS transporter [Nocardioides gilvus]
MSPTFRSLSNPNYRLYAAGGVVSNTGTWMQRIAQDWLVLVLSANSAAALGITTGLQFLPALLLGPFAGLVADRMPKHRLLQLTNIAMAVPALVLGLLAVTGSAQIWHVYVLALVLGVASALDAPARHAFVSEMVAPEDLTNAVGLNSASFNAARLVGPGLAGLLIAAWGGGAQATGWVILLNAVSYVAPVLALQLLDETQLQIPLRSATRGLRAVREGLGYVRRRPDLLLVLAVVFFAGTFGLNFQMTSALMATEVFDKGASEYGLLGSFLAIGSLAGALVAARREVTSLRTLSLAAVTFGTAVTVAGLAPSYVTFALLCPVLGLSALTLITSANTYMQLNTKASVRGRVMALYLMVMMGGTPLGAPFLGWIGEVLGARWTLLLGGGLTVVGVVAAVGVHQWLEGRRQPHFDPRAREQVA